MQAFPHLHSGGDIRVVNMVEVDIGLGLDFVRGQYTGAPRAGELDAVPKVGEGSVQVSDRPARLAPAEDRVQPGRRELPASYMPMARSRSVTADFASPCPSRSTPRLR